MNLADKMIDVVKKKKNYTIVGLDPRIEMIPDFIKKPIIDEFGYNAKGISEVFFKFNEVIIDIVSNSVGFVKPQSAFYEMYGHQGIYCLEKTIEYAKQKGLIVILDAKRNDIGSTAKAYADSYLFSQIRDEKKRLEVDLITVTPYLGYDGIKPFIDNCEIYNKGVFVLVKTSNPSSDEFQDVLCDGKKMYEIVAEKVNDWGKCLIGENGYTPIGAVVGATFPEEAKKIRELLPHSIFLVPGYGAQGGTADSIVNCFNDDGLGALVNSSRGIIFPHDDNSISEKEYFRLVSDSVSQMKTDINNALEKNGKLSW